MSETRPNLIGANVARYRKAIKMSAEELATKTGMTRSVIANLENGRKEDVLVNQLMSLAVAIGVPPIALLTDIHRPNALTAYAFPDIDLQEWDFDVSALRSKPTQGRSVEVASWVSGNLRPPRDECNEAQLDVFTAMDAMNVYSNSYRRWMSVMRRIDRLRTKIADGSAVDSDQEQLEWEEAEVDEYVDAVLQAVAVCKNAGVTIENTQTEMNRIMQKLGLKTRATDNG